MRLLVVSHPAVVPVNQEVYRELVNRGVEVTLVVPSRWRHEYAPRAFSPAALPGLDGRLIPLPVALAGKPQRHFHVARVGRVVERIRPDIAFIEAEPYALVAAQWALALSARHVPFGVQCYENIDRTLPAPIRLLRSAVLHRASFVAARSDAAGQLVRAWGARGHVALVPPAVPDWEITRRPTEGRPFTVGYAGRLTPEKGLDDLLAAVRKLDAPVQLLLAGDGAQRAVLDHQPVPGSHVRVLSGFDHEHMADAYTRMDVLVLPSRTTARWKEQFGRVIVEALWCGVPVIGSDSGEIPWLIGCTGGGLIFREGDVDALSERLAEMRADPRLRTQLADRGRAAVEKMFTVAAVTDALQRLLEGAR
jgi:glycosyltransferase involved in cell wall biosynthesis